MWDQYLVRPNKTLQRLQQVRRDDDDRGVVDLDGDHDDHDVDDVDKNVMLYKVFFCS